MSLLKKTVLDQVLDIVCTEAQGLIGATGSAVLLAFAAGIGLFFLRNLAQVLDDNGEVAPWLAAWAPPAVATALALALVLQREDG